MSKPEEGPSQKKAKVEDDVKIVAVKPSICVGGVAKEDLKIYYARLFPAAMLYRWLSYGNADYAKNREFSFTLDNNGEEIYLRYRAFTTKDELKTSLVKNLPVKIDIGAVFNVSPPLHHSVGRFIPKAKELVFDVDMSDYDDIRECCTGVNICPKCWPLMNCAAKVIDAALREDFGFEHLLWVFSGRRGIHCWVCDPHVRRLGNAEREAIVTYLSLQLGNAKKRDVEISYPLHPKLDRAYEILLPMFESTCLGAQNVLGSKKSLDRIYDLIPKEYQAELAIDEDEDELKKKWRDFKRKNLSLQQGKPKDKKQQHSLSRLRVLEQSIVFLHCYPRLDVNVSKQLNHLLKAPFCVHPKTGKVCVPIDPSSIESFDPFSVPTLFDLHRELNEIPDTPKAKGVAKTSLAPYLKYFNDFILSTEAADRADRERQKEEGGGGGVVVDDF